MKKIKIIIMLIFLSALFSCDAFLVPKEARLNPYDSENPLVQATGLVIDIVSDDSGRFVELGWTQSSTETAQSLQGFVVIRTTVGAAETIFEGSPVEIISITDADFSIKDYEFDSGKRYYYTIFAYGFKTAYQGGNNDSVPGQLELDRENGTLIDYEYFDYGAPVSTSIIVPIEISVYATADGDWDDVPSLDKGSSYFMTANSYSAFTQSVACITFNIDVGDLGGATINDATIVSAELTLTTSQSKEDAGNEGLYIDLLNANWETASNYTDVAAAGIVNSKYTLHLSSDGEIPNDADSSMIVDITEMVDAWYSGNVANNGIRLKADPSDTANNPVSFGFYSSESSNSPPELFVSYYFED